jgi:hypothetical protein
MKSRNFAVVHGIQIVHHGVIEWDAVGVGTELAGVAGHAFVSRVRRE